MNAPGIGVGKDSDKEMDARREDLVRLARKKLRQFQALKRRTPAQASPGTDAEAGTEKQTLSQKKTKTARAVVQQTQIVRESWKAARTFAPQQPEDSDALACASSSSSHPIECAGLSGVWHSNSHLLNPINSHSRLVAEIEERKSHISSLTSQLDAISTSKDAIPKLSLLVSPTNPLATPQHLLPFPLSPQQTTLSPLVSKDTDSLRASLHAKSLEINLLRDVIRGAASQFDASSYISDADIDTPLHEPDSLKACIVALRARIRELESSSTHALQSAKPILERTIETQTWDATSSPQTLQDLQRVIREKEMSVLELSRANASLRLRVASGSGDARGDTTNLTRELRETRDRLLDAERLRDEAVRGSEQALEDLRARHMAEMESLRAEMRDARASLHTANEHVLSLRARMEKEESLPPTFASSGIPHDLMVEINAARREAVRAREEAADRVRELEAEVEVLRRGRDSDHDRVLDEDDDATRQALESRLLDLEEANARLRRDAEEARRAGRDAERLRIRVLELEAAGHVRMASDTTSLQTASNAVLDTDTLLERIMFLENALTDAQATLTLTAASLSAKETSNAMTRQRTDATLELQTRLLELEASLQSLEFKRALEVRSLSLDVDRISSERDALLDRVTHLEATGLLKPPPLVEETAPTMQSTATDTQLSLAALEAENAELKAVITSLSDDLDAGNARHVELLAQLKEQTELLGARDTVSSGEYSRVLERLEGVGHHLETMKDRFHGSEARAQSLLERLMRAEAELARLRLGQADIGATLLQKGSDATTQDLLRTLQMRNNELASEIISLRSTLAETGDALESHKLRALEREGLCAAAAETQRELADLQRRFAREQETWELRERGMYAATEALRREHTAVAAELAAVRRAIWEGAEKNAGWSRGIATERVEDVDVVRWVRWMCEAAIGLERDLVETHAVLDMQHERMESVMSSVGGSVAGGGSVVYYDGRRGSGKGGRERKSSSTSRLDDIAFSSSSSSSVAALIHWSQSVGETSESPQVGSPSQRATVAANEESADLLLPLPAMDKKTHTAMKKLMARNITLQQKLERVESQLSHQLASNAEIKRMFVDRTAGHKKESLSARFLRNGGGEDEALPVLERYNDALVEIGELRAEVENWRARHDEMEAVVETVAMERLARQESSLNRDHPLLKPTGE
ncbi:hypothetical protein BC830DRAFT_1220787 [Chytriomyces sp. MP71]|nr:hypothetical protein BC830DRAFT_1220787 [Chytriomyces sp. MP71]